MQPYWWYLLYTDADPMEKSKLILAVISQFLFSQIAQIVVLIPFVLFAWFVAFKNKSKLGFYDKVLRVSGWLFMLTIPLVSIVGVLLLWLTKRYRSNVLPNCHVE